MKYEQTILGQVLKIIPRWKFQQIVDNYKGDFKTHKLPCWGQFVSLFYGQLRQRDTLRGIETGIQAQANKLYHLGIQPVKRSTLSHANNTRDNHIYEDLWVLGLLQ